MRGHGTYTNNDVLHASVAGVVQRVNKLISVLPPKTKYQGLSWKWIWVNTSKPANETWLLLNDDFQAIFITTNQIV